MASVVLISVKVWLFRCKEVVLRRVERSNVWIVQRLLVEVWRISDDLGLVLVVVEDLEVSIE